MPIKFSQFTNRTSNTAGTTIVGFDGNQNIKILSSDLVSGFINGTAHTLPVFATANTLGDSIISQDASATQLFVNGKVGIGRTLLPGGPNLEVYSTGNPFADIRSVQAGGSVSQGARIYLTAEDTVANKQGQVDINIHGPSHSTEAYSFEIANISNPTPTTGGDIFFSSRPAGSTIELVRFKEDGKVGIGTAAPGGKLEVNGGTGVATSGGTLIVRQDGDTSNDGIALTSSNSISHRMYKNAGGIFLMGPSTDSDAFALDLNGNVGIGTTAPSQKLEVGGNVLLQNNDEIRFKDSGGTERTAIELDPSNNFNIGTSAGGNLRFINGSSYTERMRITSAGNVGIGTDSPGGLLHVSSGTSGDAIVIIESDTDDTDNSDNPHLEFRQDGNTIRGKIGLEGTAGQTYSNSVANATYLGSVFEQPLQFITGDTGSVQTAKMTILANTGNVGIGTTTPASKLEVNGSGTQLQVNNGGDKFLDVDNVVTKIGDIDGVADESYVQMDGASSEFSFYQSTAQRIVLDSNAYIRMFGQGTNNASGAELHIRKGTSNEVEGNVKVNYGTFPNSHFQLQYQDPANTNEINLYGEHTYFNNPLRIGANAEANELNDFEQGTANLEFGLSYYYPGSTITYYGSGDFTSWTNNSKYVKIGTLVTVFIDIVYNDTTAPTNWGSSSYRVWLGGLPFTVVGSYTSDYNSTNPLHGNYAYGRGMTNASTDNGWQIRPFKWGTYGMYYGFTQTGSVTTPLAADDFKYTINSMGQTGVRQVTGIIQFRTT